MFDTPVDRLTAEQALTLAGEMRAVADRAEARLLEVAAHWGDLHGQLDQAEAGASLPGMERLVQLGGEGTPEIAEFAPAELGAVLAMSPYSAATLVADGLDLRHRLPVMWARLRAGEVKPWIGRKTAEATRHLPLELAAAVDRRVAKWAHSLSWGRLEAMISAAIIEAHPQAAADAVERTERSQGVWLGQSTDHGIKDIHIRTEAPNAIWFDASIDRIADGLALLGDRSSTDIRRARAVGVIAQPQQALDLFNATARAAAAGDDGGSDQQPGVGGEPGDSRAVKERSEGPEATGAQTTTRAGGRGVDPRPPATLYIHLNEDSVTRDELGAARVEGVGPVTAEQVKAWLGHCEVTVKPVIDLAGQAPVDAYEIPDRLREAVHLRNPVDVFPYATNTGRSKDIDHTDPYIPPENGGPPGQTALANLGPMTRFHHRIKTHGRWRVVQVFDNVFVWRSPHGRTYLVDNTGTRPFPTSA